MLIDNGLKMDELEGLLNEMDEEELIRELKEALEYVCMYRSAFDMAKHIVKNRSRNNDFFSSRLMKQLDFPKVSSSYNTEQWTEVSDLRYDLKEMAHRLGYLYAQEGNGFRCRKDTERELLEWCMDIEPYDESEDIVFP